MKISELQNLISKFKPATNVSVSWKPLGRSAQKRLVALAQAALSRGGFQTLADSLVELHSPYASFDDIVMAVSSLVEINLDLDVDVLESLHPETDTLSPQEVIRNEALSARPGDVFRLMPNAPRSTTYDTYRVISNNGISIVGDDTMTRAPLLKSFLVDDCHKKGFQIIERAHSRPLVVIKTGDTMRSRRVELSITQHIALMLGCSCLSLLFGGLAMFLVNGVAK